MALVGQEKHRVRMWRVTDYVLLLLSASTRVQRISSSGSLELGPGMEMDKISGSA